MFLQTFIVPFGNRHITFNFTVDGVVWISPYVVEEMFFWIPGTFEHQWEKQFKCLSYRPFYFSRKEEYRRLVSEDVFAIILFSFPIPTEIAVWYNEYVKKILKLSSMTHKTPRRLQQTVKNILTLLSELQLFNKRYADVFNKHIPNIFEYEGVDHFQYRIEMSKLYLNQQVRLLELLKYSSITTEPVFSKLMRCADTSPELVAQLGPTTFPYTEEPSAAKTIDLVCHETIPDSPDTPSSPDFQENILADPVEIPTSSTAEVVYEYDTLPLDLSKKRQASISKEEWNPVYEKVPTPDYSTGHFPLRLETPEPKFPNKLKDLNEEKTTLRRCPYTIVKIFKLDKEGKVLKFTHCKRISVKTSLKRLKIAKPHAVELFSGRMLPKDGDILRIMYNKMINHGISCKSSRNTFSFDTVEDANFMLALCKTMFETKQFK